jgi:hypothetical protein
MHRDNHFVTRKEEKSERKTILCSTLYTSIGSDPNEIVVPSRSHEKSVKRHHNEILDLQKN